MHGQLMPGAANGLDQVRRISRRLHAPCRVYLCHAQHLEQAPSELGDVAVGVVRELGYRRQVVWVQPQAGQGEALPSGQQEDGAQQELAPEEERAVTEGA